MKILALIVTALALASCNTMSGFGRDMQKAGSSLETTAERSATR